MPPPRHDGSVRHKNCSDFVCLNFQYRARRALQFCGARVSQPEDYGVMDSSNVYCCSFIVDTHGAALEKLGLGGPVEVGPSSRMLPVHASIAHS